MTRGFYFTMVFLGLLGMGAAASATLWFLHGKEVIEKHEQALLQKAQDLGEKVIDSTKTKPQQKLLAQLFGPRMALVKKSLQQSLLKVLQVEKITLLKMAGAYPQIILTTDNKVRAASSDRLQPAIEKVAFTASQKYTSEKKPSHYEINQKLFYLRVFSTIYAQERNQLLLLVELPLEPLAIGDDVLKYIFLRVGILLSVLAIIATLVYFLILAKIE